MATDLVGRGIDIERVNIVINYDMPETDDKHGNGADTYLHRVSLDFLSIFTSCLRQVISATTEYQMTCDVVRVREETRFLYAILQG